MAEVMQKYMSGPYREKPVRQELTLDSKEIAEACLAYIIAKYPERVGVDCKLALYVENSVENTPGSIKTDHIDSSGWPIYVKVSAHLIEDPVKSK